jgi:hypothetical protein
MTDLRTIDALVRQNALQMLGSDALPQRYIASLNMIKAMSPGMSPGMLRLKPEDVKPGKTPAREPL